MPIILVFDTETTGLPQTKLLNPITAHLWPHVVQFSYVIYDTDSHKILKIVDSIIKVPDGIIIGDESIKIHGITNEMSEKGNDLTILLEVFFQDIQTVKFVIGHNVQFDLNMVKIELLRLIENKTLTNEQFRLYKDILFQVTYVTRFVCTMEDTKQYCNILTKSKKGDMYQKFPSLKELYHKLFNKTPNNLHNSLNDVLITLICFVEFHYRENITEKCVEVRNMVTGLGLV
jgi:DNA polymerase III epsilon subunit-like protein